MESVEILSFIVGVTGGGAGLAALIREVHLRRKYRAEADQVAAKIQIDLVGGAEKIVGVMRGEVEHFEQQLEETRAELRDVKQELEECRAETARLKRNADL